MDQVLNLFCRLRAALRQGAHFGGDNRKTFPLIARACGFHSGIERQNVGLKSDTVNHRGDLRNTVRAESHIFHGIDHFLRNQAAFAGILRRFFRQQARLVSVFRIQRDGGGQLFHAGCGLHHGSRLLLGA
ncbi:hypothetical protein D3C72_505290 [compost metagenome]